MSIEPYVVLVVVVVIVLVVIVGILPVSAGR